MTTAHVLDLIEHALDDCAVSNDAVRYGPQSPPPQNVFTGIEYIITNWTTDRYTLFAAARIQMGQLSLSANAYRVGVKKAKRAHLRRMHTAHPARWRKP